MLAALGERPGKSLPTAFQDWANTKAAYRFFANENVSEDKILAGHFAASGLRVRATDGPILVLQDTTEFLFKRAAPEKIGFTKTSCGRKGKEGRHSQHMICGHAHACQPRRDTRRFAARADSSEILVPGKV
jgi:hypothetical protein